MSGALTKGDRRAATGADLNEFNFDTNYGRSALRSMYLSISSVSTLRTLQTFLDMNCIELMRKISYSKSKMADAVGADVTSCRTAKRIA